MRGQSSQGGMSSSLIDRTITRGCGGIGRHAALRGQCSQGRMSSSLINRTNNEISKTPIKSESFSVIGAINLSEIFFDSARGNFHKNQGELSARLKSIERCIDNADK